MLGALFVFRLRVFLSGGIFLFHQDAIAILASWPERAWWRYSAWLLPALHHTPSSRRHSLPAMALASGASAPTPPGNTSASTTTQPSKCPSCKSDTTVGKSMLTF